MDAHRFLPELVAAIEEEFRRVPVPSMGGGEQRRIYLQRLMQECNRARLLGLDPEAADPTKGRALTLEQIYVALDTTTHERAGWPLSALKAVEGFERSVLLGLPGSGKSTFLRYLVLLTAARARLPVLVPLALFARNIPAGEKKGHAGLVERFLSVVFDSQPDLQGFGSEVLAELRRRGGLVLFDGLDEVVEVGQRSLIREAIEDFAVRYERCRVIVTCRTYSYTDPRWQLTGWPTYELAPFSKWQIQKFIAAWYSELARVDPQRSAAYMTKHDRLQEALRPGERRQLAEIAPNPLLLTVMAVVHTHEGELPDARALVYEKCVDLLLLRWQLAREELAGVPSSRQSLLDALGVPKVTVEKIFQEVAYKAHQGESGGMDRRSALVTEDLLAAVLQGHLRESSKVKTFLDYCEGANGLLLLQGVTSRTDAPIDDEVLLRTYAFPHLTFQEYLAARYLRRKANLASEVLRHADRGDRWREVIRLLVEHLCFREGDTESVEAILAKLVPEPESRGDWWVVWLAGELLLLLRRALQGAGGDTALDQRVVERLVALLAASALSAKERAAAGNTLAELGDPRPWVRRVDAMQFCWVPAGPFWMGDDRFADEQPQHLNQHLDYEYWLARYPVTVAQFRAFETKSGQGPENHPIVKVSWEEAQAFCAWLSERWHQRKWLPEGWVVRLPSEAEWEKAARGGLEIPVNPIVVSISELPARGRKKYNLEPRRAFPWHDVFERERCNGRAAGIGSTSAVGCFPKGASPYGGEELSGNVWEWTRSQWGNNLKMLGFEYPYDPKDGREDGNLSKKPCVLRGGTFDQNVDLVRCSVRHWSGPSSSSDIVGFRVVLSPPRQ